MKIAKERRTLRHFLSPTSRAVIYFRKRGMKLMAKIIPRGDISHSLLISIFKLPKLQRQILKFDVRDMLYDVVNVIVPFILTYGHMRVFISHRCSNETTSFEKEDFIAYIYIYIFKTKTSGIKKFHTNFNNISKTLISQYVTTKLSKAVKQDDRSLV